MKSFLTLLVLVIIDLATLELSAQLAFTSQSNISIQATDPYKVALDYIQANLDTWGLTNRDIAEMTVSDMYTDKSSGITRIYFQQQYKGIPVHNAILNICMTRDGKVFYTTHRFVKDIAHKINALTPAISPQEAITQFASRLGITTSGIRMKLSDTDGKFIFDKGSIAREDIPSQLIFQPLNGEVFLSWDIFFLPLGNFDQWSVRVDANSGKILDQDNWTLYCQNDRSIHNSEKENCESERFHAHQKSIVTTNNQPHTGVQYNVFAVPFESPLVGPRTMVTNPADSIASPYGWHDINGQPGHEYTITRGNNVNAYQDRDNLGYSSGDEPDGGPELHFDFPFDISWEPHEYIDAAVVNLYYWMNYLHDFTYRFGFDEPAGNFQRNNYGRGGQGNDFVWAVAQCEANGDTLHNNAVYYHKNEGAPPSIYMLDFLQLTKYLKVHAPLAVSGTYLTNLAGAGWGQGAYITSTPVTGEVILVNDGVDEPSTADACQPILNANELVGKIALIDRGGGCQFGYKALQAQNAGAIGVIFCNYEKSSWQNIGGGPDGANVNIPVVLLSVEDVRVLREYAGKGLTVSIVNPGPYVPARFDSDFQSSIMAHEYGHGLSIRLAGGPDQVCMDNAEQMGEGWSDFLGLVTTVLPGDSGSKKRSQGTYVLGEDLSGSGLRRLPYSTDMNIAPLTYGDVAAAQQKHDVGEVWANMLWDMYWAFSDRYGWSENPYEESSGNYKAVRLVVDGLKNMSCDPGFVDGRDAILAADSALFNGENACMIWEVFARRGLGYSADQGSPYDAGDQIEAFDIPPFCTGEVFIEKSMSPFIQAGNDIDVQINVGNYKSTTATNVIISDQLQEGTSLVSGSSNYPVINFGSHLEFAIGELHPGEELMISYKLHSASGKKSNRLFLDEISNAQDSAWLVKTIGSSTVNNWFVTDSVDAHSGNFSWYIHEVPVKSHEALVMNPEVYSFHVEGQQPVLRFYHRYNTQAGTTGGIIEVREVGTTNWERNTAKILRNGYDSKLDYKTFLLSDVKGFSGKSENEFEASYVDLQPWTGKDIQIRFRFASYTNEHPNGYWQIDDIEFMDLLNYNGEACLTSDQGDLACVTAKEHGTIVDSQNETTGTDSPANSIIASIYPNPTSDLITISLSCDGVQSIHARILSIDGKELIRKEVQATGNTSIPISTTELPAGIYLACIQADGGYYSEKFVVRR